MTDTTANLEELSKAFALGRLPCGTGKVAHLSKRDAEQAIRVMVGYQGIGKLIGVYSCLSCGFWHAGGVRE